MNTKTPTPSLADVALDSPGQNLEFALSDVGLENVQTQITYEGLRLPARAHAGVSLIDRKARGIHMSRLFRLLMRLHEQELGWNSLRACLTQMLSTHEALSDAGHLSVHFELPVLRKALITAEQGWRNYPVTFKTVSHQGQMRFQMAVRVLYSSTCPCSASLSRQAIRDEFLATFAGTSTVPTEQVAEWIGGKKALAAVPHAQRSEAVVEVTVDPAQAPSILSLIDEIENALGTPVQSAVKRDDEQEFARRNAQNLMFCEDAARKLKAALMKRAELLDFSIEVKHFESLHPHDVVARVSKF